MSGYTKKECVFHQLRSLYVYGIRVYRHRLVGELTAVDIFNGEFAAVYILIAELQVSLLQLLFVGAVSGDTCRLAHALAYQVLAQLPGIFLPLEEKVV